MIWRCIDRTKPPRDYDEEEWREFMYYQSRPTGTGFGQGGEYMLGFAAGGDGVGMGFDHGMLKGGNVDWGDR